MRIYKKEEIRAWDQFTIENEKISSLELMERASIQFVKRLENLFDLNEKKILILCGLGNNGGDGFCISRMLSEKAFHVETILFSEGHSLSPDCQYNFELLKQKQAKVIEDPDLKNLDLMHYDLIIDGLFGSGLNRPLEGFFGDIVDYVNKQDNTVISIDIPSGLDADRGKIGPCIKADYTLSFQQPKYAFFLRDCMQFVGHLEIVEIGLHAGFLNKVKTNKYVVKHSMVQALLKPREKTADKSNYGYAQLCGGSSSMLGAILLAAKAALRTGLGRLIIQTPRIHHQTVFSNIPEAMVHVTKGNEAQLIEFKKANKQINALACGPGLGTGENSKNYLSEMFSKYVHPMILDADALNIIAKQKWLDQIPPNSIITPHEGEFSRLFGDSPNDYARKQLQLEKSKESNIYIILKGPHTVTTTPVGEIYINSTGNPGMATAGSGDVLTGILLSLFAQGYNAKETCILGVYLHGLAGDIAALEKSENGLIASDIIDSLPSAFKTLNNVQ